MDRLDYNKSIQIFSLCSKLYSLVRGLYTWDNRIKQYSPVKKFSEQFEVVIKTAEDLKRYGVVEFLMGKIKELEVPKRERK